MRHPALLSLLVALAHCGCHSQSSSGRGGADAGTDTATDTVTDTDTETSTDYTAIDVSAGGGHTCVVLAGGGVKCWGYWHGGCLGYGDDLEQGIDVTLPSTLPFVEVGGPVERISAGGGTCALIEGGVVKCWGSGALGMPAVPDIGVDDVPANYPALDLGGTVVQVSRGGGHACVLLQGGDVKCWGENEWGQLGNADDWHVINAALVLPIDLGGQAIDVSAGGDHTCAVLENGDALCWGNPGSGKLGYGNTEIVGNDEVPADVGPIDLGGPAVQVSAGSYHTCVVLEGGAVRCWGNGEHGQLGYGSTESVGDDEVPADVGPVEVGGQVEQVTCGSGFTCARFVGGAVKCWGALPWGYDEPVGDDEVPADVGPVDLGDNAAWIDAGTNFACAVLDTGLVMCWGWNQWGQLGYGNEEDVGDDEVPADVGPVPVM